MDRKKVISSRDISRILNEAENALDIKEDIIQNLSQELNSTKKTLEKAQSEITRLKLFTEQLPDSQTVEELENRNRENLKIIKSMRKELRESEEKFKDKNASLEREKLLLETKLQSSDEARKDLQERFKELKEELRYYQKKE
jgi:golgin subfamily B member 1